MTIMCHQSTIGEKQVSGDDIFVYKYLKRANILGNITIVLNNRISIIWIKIPLPKFYYVLKINL